MNDEQLKRAIEIATTAHRGQVDKAGEPYLKHPLRVMERVNTVCEKICAVLHDVLEDSEITLSDLRDAGFTETILTALDALTRRCLENYESYIARVAQNRLATIVKLADLYDNLNTDRLTQISDDDRARLARYQGAVTVLMDAMARPQGDLERKLIVPQRERSTDSVHPYPVESPRSFYPYAQDVCPPERQRPVPHRRRCRP